MKTESSQPSKLRQCGFAAANELVGVISVLVLGCAMARGADVTYDFNTDDGSQNYVGTIWDGSTMAHTGSVIWEQTGGAGFVGGTTNGPTQGFPGDGFLQLTFASWSCGGNLGSFLCGAWLLDDFDRQSLAGFTIECDLRMGNGDPAPVGGFSVNFVRPNDPVLEALNEGDTVPQMNGQISTNGGRFSDYGNAGDLSLIEEGTTTGLSVGFQMQDNGDYHIPPDAGALGMEAPGIIHDGIGLHIRLDGTVIAAVPMPNGTTQQTYDQYGNPLTASDPKGTNASTDPTAIETGPYNGSGCDTNLWWVHFKMDLSTNGALNVWWKNFQVVTNLPTSFLPYHGRFLIAARTGSRPANIEIDNVALTTIPIAISTNPPTLNITQHGGQAIITYTGILQSSPLPTSGYVDVPDATSPYTVPQGSRAMFFRSGW